MSDFYLDTNKDIIEWLKKNGRVKKRLTAKIPVGKGCPNLEVFELSISKKPISAEAIRNDYKNCVARLTYEVNILGQSFDVDLNEAVELVEILIIEAEVESQNIYNLHDMNGVATTTKHPFSLEYAQALNLELANGVIFLDHSESKSLHLTLNSFLGWSVSGDDILVTRKKTRLLKYPNIPTEGENDIITRLINDYGFKVGVLDE